MKFSELIEEVRSLYRDMPDESLQSCTFISRPEPTLEEVERDLLRAEGNLIAQATDQMMIDMGKRTGVIGPDHPLAKGCQTYRGYNWTRGTHGFGCKCRPKEPPTPPLDVVDKGFGGPTKELTNEQLRSLQADFDAESWNATADADARAEGRSKTRGEEIAEKEIRDNRLSADRPESFFCMACWVSAPSADRELAMRGVRERLTNLIDKAIADEREACAKVAERLLVAVVPDAIRSRSA